MRLLRALMALQASKGAVSDADLEALAHSEGVPLYRLEGLRSFYPVFREQAGAPVQVQVCRDVDCRMAGGAGHCASIRNALIDSEHIEISEVSCIGLCDQAPAAMINDRPIGGTVDEIRDYATGAHALPEADPQARSWPTDPYESPSTHYDGFRRLLAESNPEAIIQPLKDADLRGLGGSSEERRVGRECALLIGLCWYLQKCCV